MKFTPNAKLRCGIDIYLNGGEYKSTEKSYSYILVNFKNPYTNPDSAKQLGEMFQEIAEKGYTLRRICSNEECYESSCESNLTDMLMQFRKEII